MTKPETGRCRSCGQEIVWTVTTNGKKMPCDIVPAQNGEFFLFRKGKLVEAVHGRSDDGRVARALMRGDNSYNSHFATCPHSASHRKRGAR